MRVGLFGSGRIGTLHASILAANAHVERLVICDADHARAQQAAAAVSADVAATPDALLRHVDAAVVATPTDTHAELVHRCLDARVTTFCEKPVALDLAELRKVADHAADAATPLQVGFQRRFDAGYTEAKRRHDAGELGRVYAFRLAGHDPAPPHAGYIGASGGIFKDLHIHDFDILRFVLGHEVAAVHAAGAVLGFDEFAEHDDYDTSAATLRLVDGTLGVLTGGRHNPAGYDIRMELFGSRDSVAVGLDERVPLRSVEPGMRPFDGPAWPDFQHRFFAAYHRELDGFVDVARGAAPNPCTVDDAYQALRIAEAATRSAHEGRTVALDEI